MEPASSPNTSLAECFRFAFLLTGNAAVAGDALTAALTETQARRADLGGRESCHSWLLKEVRRQCLERPHPGREELVGDTQRSADDGSDAMAPHGLATHPVAEKIHALPEPQRSAVALFYLDLCGPEELATLLGLSLEDFADALSAGRTKLSGLFVTPPVAT